MINLPEGKERNLHMDTNLTVSAAKKPQLYVIIRQYTLEQTESSLWQKDISGISNDISASCISANCYTCSEVSARKATKARMAGGLSFNMQSILWYLPSPLLLVEAQDCTKVPVKDMASDLKQMLLRVMHPHWSVTAYTKKWFIKGSTALTKDAHRYANSIAESIYAVNASC